MEEQKPTETESPKSTGTPATVATGSVAPVSAPKSFGVASDAQKKTYGGRGGSTGGARGGHGRGAGPKDSNKRGGRADRPRSEVRRVARVVAGGRRFSFSVAMIAGDRKGKVGVGTGKAGDIAMAMDKASKDAKKHMITIKLTKTSSIPHQVMAKSSSGTIQLIPAPSRGLVAGSAVRNVLELAGITDVSAKILSGSKNKLNIARATIKALSAIREGKKVVAVKTDSVVVAGTKA